MRSLSLLSASLGLALAAPWPQDIEFDLAYAVPEPTTVSQAVGVTAQTVSYDAATVFTAALAQITSTQTDTAGIAVATTDVLEKRDTACATQPAGSGPIPSPDNASTFLSYTPFADAANAAPIPSGYAQSFTNVQGASNAYGYLGYTTLASYDTNACAAKCNKINGCIAFNIYFERDPSVAPGSSCANPPSTTNIKCVFFGGPVTADNAVNKGQWRSSFQVVIAGSNGYTNTTVASIPGYSSPVPLGNAAINAPFDTLGYNSYMGSAIFVGQFNAQLCADACTAKSNYAIQHPPTDGSPVQTCQFFNTYILYINDTSHIQGQYCAMYSESWPASYATNVGQYRGADHFKILYSFAYSNATNPGTPSANAAVYQARNDILWPGNSVQPFCSSILGYTTPVVTTTLTSTVAPVTTTTAIDIALTTFSTTSYATTTATFTSTTTITVNAKRAEPTDNASPGRHQVATAGVQKRAISTPDVLTKYPANIITSACSLAVSPVTVTSTTSTTTTTTLPTSTITQSSTITIATTVVLQSTVTVTTTDVNSAIATATPSSTCAATPCGQTVKGADGFHIKVDCNMGKGSGSGASVLSQSTYSCFNDCLNAADASFSSTSFTWQLSTSTCTIYSDTNSATSGEYANTDYIYGYFPQ